MNREPLLTWEPTLPASHPMNYPVPDFGVDHDIAASHASTATAEASTGNKWEPELDKDGKYIVPGADIEFKLM